MSKEYKSQFKKLTTVFLPKFSDTRVLMMPFLMEDISSLPNDLSHYQRTVEELVAISPEKTGVAYLTIDEKSVKKYETHRLRGLHVDGVGADDRTDLGIWARHSLKHYIACYWSESKAKWYQGAAGIGGMITVSNPAGCRAWNKSFEGGIRYNGDCEHLRKEYFPESESTVFEANSAYWCNAACVHESLYFEKDTERTFVRLSMPSDAPWYVGYTKNPKGTEPTGPVSHHHRSIETEVILKG